MVGNALCFNGTTDSVLVANQAEINFIGSCKPTGRNPSPLTPGSGPMPAGRVPDPAGQARQCTISAGLQSVPVLWSAGIPNRRRCELRKLHQHHARFAGWTVALHRRDGGPLRHQRERRHALRGRATVSPSSTRSRRSQQLGGPRDWAARSLLGIQLLLGLPRRIGNLQAGAGAAGNPGHLQRRFGRQVQDQLSRGAGPELRHEQVFPCPTNWSFDEPSVSDPCCGTSYTLTYSTVTNSAGCSNSFTRPGWSRTA